MPAAAGSSGTPAKCKLAHVDLVGEKGDRRHKVEGGRVGASCVSLGRWGGDDALRQPDLGGGAGIVIASSAPLTLTGVKRARV